MSFVIYNRSQLPDTLSGLKAALNKTNNQLQKANSRGRKYQLKVQKQEILKKMELFKPSYSTTSSLVGRATPTENNLPTGLSPFQSTVVKNDKGKEKDQSGEKELDNQPSDEIESPGVLEEHDEYYDFYQENLGEKELNTTSSDETIFAMLQFIQGLGIVYDELEEGEASGEKELHVSNNEDNDADNLAMLELFEATIASSNEELSGEKESDFDPKPDYDFDTLAIEQFFEEYKEEAEISSSNPSSPKVDQIIEISERTGLIATCQALYRKCISNPLIGQSLNPMLISALVLLPTSFFLVKRFSPNLFDIIYKAIFGKVVQKTLVKASEAGKDTIRNAFSSIDLTSELPVGCTGYTFTAAILQFCDHWRKISKYLVTQGHSVEWLEKHKQLPKDIALFLKELIGIHGKAVAFKIINQLKVRVWLFQGFHADWRELIQIDRIGAWLLKWALENKLPS